jgi:hypothetical protein
LADVSVLTDSVCALKRRSGGEFMVVSSRGRIGVVGGPSRAVGCGALEGGVSEREWARHEPVSIWRSPAGLLVSTPPEVPVSVHDRRLVAVARTFGCAEEAAARGDYADALSWVGAVEAIGDLIPIAYQPERQAWHTALAVTGEKRGLVMTDWRSGETSRGS